MANMVRQIMEQKLREIQNRLPFGVNIIRATKNTPSFKEILKEAQENTPLQSELTTKQQMAPELGTFSIASGKYRGIVQNMANKYRMEPDLIDAIIKVESNYNPFAISKAGAMGLMQLMPDTAESLGISNPFDPAQNIEGGIRFFKAQLARFNGDIDLALAAYNCGPARIVSLGITNLNDPYQFEKLPSETRQYIEKIHQCLGK
jgi:soluble lytic murein transglycosylase-like protein